MTSTEADPKPQAEYGAATTSLTSTQLAAGRSLACVWDPSVPFPPAEEMRDLDMVTHVNVQRGLRGEFHYLHECAIARHQQKLFICWANHPLYESNEAEEIIRGTSSSDGGLTWETPQTWIAPPTAGGASYNHPVLATREGKLFGFITRWVGREPDTTVFVLDDSSDEWRPTLTRIPEFIPFGTPMQLANGTWIMSGEKGWNEPAVAVSHGDDWTRWDLVCIPRPEGMVLRFPETTLIDQGDRLLAFCRPFKLATAPVSFSTDFGRTWAPLQLSNFPLAPSQPYAGVLSTGHHYLLTNNLEHGRALMTIAIAEPGSRTFSRIRKVRHQQYPIRRLFGGIRALGGNIKSYVGKPTEWSYPSAIELDGKLYITYTQGKEDCVLSIIPLCALTQD